MHAETSPQFLELLRTEGQGIGAGGTRIHNRWIADPGAGRRGTEGHQQGQGHPDPSQSGASPGPVNCGEGNHGGRLLVGWGVAELGATTGAALSGSGVLPRL
jgi:hypothetical protein